MSRTTTIIWTCDRCLSPVQRRSHLHHVTLIKLLDKEDQYTSVATLDLCDICTNKVKLAIKPDELP